MSKTAELRKLVKEQLDTVPGGTYHRKAPDNAEYPYKTFSLKSVSFTDERDDFDLCVDIWHRGDFKIIEELADQKRQSPATNHFTYVFSGKPLQSRRSR